MQPQLEISPDEFTMLISGIDEIKYKCLQSLKVSSKSDTIAKKELEIEACNMLIRKLSDYFVAYKRRIMNKRLRLKPPTWQNDCNGRIVDPDSGL